MSQERDSYKGVLDSFEHELTIVGSQYDQGRVAALNKIVEDHKSVIEDLEEQLKAAKSAGGATIPENVVDSAEVLKLRSDLKSLMDRLKKAENERDDVMFEMERRAIRYGRHRGPQCNEVGNHLFICV